MRHKRDIRKLSRNKSARKALMRSLALSLIKSRQIETTEAKAKELRRVVERLITLGKREDLASHRRVVSYLDDPETARLVREMAAGFKERPGGYTRIIRTEPRRGDSAPMVLIKIL